MRQKFCQNNKLVISLPKIIDMKNIYVLSTDKPSRLRIGSDGLNLSGLEFIEATNKQNIYITSDEKIKKGDWYYNPRTKTVLKRN